MTNATRRFVVPEVRTFQVRAGNEVWLRWFKALLNHFHHTFHDTRQCAEAFFDPSTLDPHTTADLHVRTWLGILSPGAAFALCQRCNSFDVVHPPDVAEQRQHEIHHEQQK